MLTRVVARICRTMDRKVWTRQKCQGLKLQPKELFYPISWPNYRMYFEPEDLDEALETMKDSSIIHVWNDRSSKIWNKIGTKNAYQVTAERKCPLIYGSSEYF